MRLLLLAFLCLLIAGCMSGGGNDTTVAKTTPELTKDEFTRQADAICAKYDAQLAELPQPETLDALASMATAALPIAQAGVDELRGLDPPADQEDAFDRWLDLNDKNIGYIEQLRDAAEAGDETETQKIAAAAKDNEIAADEAAAALGFSDCAASDR